MPVVHPGQRFASVPKLVVCVRKVQGEDATKLVGDVDAVLCGDDRFTARVMDAAPWHESFRDNFFTIDREGAVTWHGDAAAGETLRAAVADVSFAAIARECGVVAN